MDNFVWRNVFSVDIELFDKQHQHLFSLGKELYYSVLNSNSEKTIDKVILELCDYAVYHFQDEEYYMKKYNFPKIEEHIKSHENFKSTVEKFAKDNKEGKKYLAMKIIHFLQEWLVEHILKEDKLYTEYIADKKIHSVSENSENTMDCD